MVFAESRKDQHSYLVATTSMSHAFFALGYIEMAVCGECRTLFLKEKLDATGNTEHSFKKT